MANLAGPLQEKDPLSLRLDFCAFDRREVAAGVVVCLCRGLAARTNLHWKGTLWRQIHKRIPVISGIVLRCRLEAGSDDRSQRQGLARHRFHWLRIHQAIASHPNLVIRLGQLRQQVPPSVIRHNDLAKLCRQVSGFRNPPHTRLRSLRTGDDAADIVAVHGDATGCRRRSHRIALRSSCMKQWRNYEEATR